MTEEDTFFKSPRYLMRKQNILRLLKRYPIKSFIDVGCGAGELACTLSQRGLNGVGIDFSNDAIKHAEKIRKDRHIASDKLGFKVGGLEKVNKSRFDLVICCEVLEHVEDDRKLLHELCEHSKDLILISVPAKQKLFDESDEAVGHFRRYERQQLKDLLTSEGLEILEFIAYGFPYTDALRILRKGAFRKKLQQSSDESMESRSKQSGINPVKLNGKLQRLDIEPLVRALTYTTLPFNSTNLSDSYLVLARVNRKG